MVTQKFDLNMIPGKPKPIIRASQYDTGLRAFEVSLFAGTDTYTIPSGATLTVQGTKPDYTGFSYSATYAGNTVTFDCTDQMTACAGAVEVEIVVVSEGERVATANFVLQVEPAALKDDTIISETDIPIIEQLPEMMEDMDKLISTFGGPNVAETAAEMTDQDKVYVYIGSETGYNSGHWYYYDKTAHVWKDGGIYQSAGMDLDTTLTVSGKAADAKAVGDALALKANLASPTFTGYPKAPTASLLSYNTQIANTEFVKKLVLPLDDAVNGLEPTEIEMHLVVDGTTGTWAQGGKTNIYDLLPGDNVEVTAGERDAYLVWYTTQGGSEAVNVSSSHTVTAGATGRWSTTDARKLAVLMEDTSGNDVSPASFTINGVEKGLNERVGALETTKQDTLTFDTTPTEGSTNPVTSGGIYQAIPALDDTLTVAGDAADAKITGEKITVLKNSVNGTGLQSYVKIAEYPILPFEIGAIQITTDGWDYQENNKRIRTPQGQEIWLNAGDIIALTDYTNARFYLGVRRADGTYAAASWKTADFTVTIPGWYVILVGRITGETALANVEDLATLVRITRIKTTQNTVDDMQNVLEYAQYAFDAYPIHGINHRGMQYEAPENTLPAFRLSVGAGYKFVETDIQFTSDNIPVLLHDTTLNRTARNADGSELASTINISDITYAQALEYAFPVVNGVYDASFLTNKIMSFEEFIVFCKRTEIFPYLELKLEATYTQAQVNILIDILTKYNMLRNVSWISWSDDWLRMIVNADKGARIGRIKNSEISGAAVTALNTLKTGYNRVFWSITPYTNDWTITEASFTRAMANDQGISIGVISTKDGMDNVLDHFANSGYISGCLSNGRVNFQDVVNDIAMGTGT